MGGVLARLWPDHQLNQGDPILTSPDAFERALEIALRSQEDFQRFAQRMAPITDELGPAMMEPITQCVREVIHRSAIIVRKASVPSKTFTNQMIGADFDYDIVVPSGQATVTFEEMTLLAQRLQQRGFDAFMGPTALKLRFWRGRLEGSIDLVPRPASFLESSVVANLCTNDSHTDRRRRIAARVLKYFARYVRYGEHQHYRSLDIEWIVLTSDARFTIGEVAGDPHGLELFKRACWDLELDLPH